MALTVVQQNALTLVKDDRVRYVPIPISRKDTPYFLVDRKRSPKTRTFKSLMKQGLIRQSAPTMRSIEVILTPQGEEVFA